jgi:hypothetical protein
MTYAQEAAALDANILGVIARYGRAEACPEFEALALEIFAHQLRYNGPYAQYCAAFGVTLERLPESWEDIPAIPTAAYKEAALCTFDPASAQLTFRTSGTTVGTSGSHYMETPALYDAALLAGFARVFSTQNRATRYMLLVPNPAERPHSSLGYMMREAARAFSETPACWLLDGDELRVDAFVEQTRAAQIAGTPVLLASTAFALVQLLDALRERGIESLPLPPGSSLMETGGFKGRTRVVERGTLYRELAQMFALVPEQIVAEYGMTELTSQYYDVTFPADFGQARVKRSGPWLRPRVVGADGKTLPKGVVGALVHVDLANRSSCVAVQTEDLGVEVDGGLVLIGREQGAELRGCSLDAESLRAARA